MRLVITILTMLAVGIALAAVLGVGAWHPLLRTVYAVIAGLLVWVVLWKWGPK